MRPEPPGEFIHEQRRRYGLSQQQLARAAGLPLIRFLQIEFNRGPEVSEDEVDALYLAFARLIEHNAPARIPSATAGTSRLVRHKIG